jgi:hypothetical protein
MINDKVRIIIIIIPTLLCCCKKWDPNEQYSSEISSSNKIQGNFVNSIEVFDFNDIKLGDSLSRVISIIGKEYKISASLIKNNVNWLKIEIRNEVNAYNMELLFKNSELVKIHKY